MLAHYVKLDSLLLSGEDKGLGLTPKKGNVSVADDDNFAIGDEEEIGDEAEGMELIQTGGRSIFYIRIVPQQLLYFVLLFAEFI